MPSILILDKQWIFSFALKNSILSILPDAKVETCSRTTDLLDRVKSAGHDILIIDTSLVDNLAGPTLLQYIRSQLPLLKIMVICEPVERMNIRQYFSKGVLGYIERDIPEPEFRKAFLMVNNGDMYLSINFLLSMIKQPKPKNTGENAYWLSLTERQREIATYLLEGGTQSELCRRLGLKSSTISTHKQNIFKKMGVKNLPELFYRMQALNNRWPLKKDKKNTG